MRLTVLKDTKIPQKDYELWQLDDTAFFQKNADITPVYYTEEKNFSSYPTEIDEDGDVRPRMSWVETLADDVKARIVTGKQGSVI